MARKITVTLFQFDELDDDAKEKARDWFRNGIQLDEWWECVYDDAERIGLKISGFDLGGRMSIDAKLTESVSEVCRRILAEHGKDCRTWKTAIAFLADRRNGKTKAADEYEGEEIVESFRNELAQDYFFMLRDEYEYQYSDECVDESIRANEYEFTEEGEIA
jgi:hypothetical protein